MNANRKKTNLKPKEWLGLAFSIVLLVASLSAQCPYGTPYEALLSLLTGCSPRQVALQESPSYQELDVKTPFGNTFQFQASTPAGPPYPATTQVIWTAPPGASNINRSHGENSVCFEANGSTKCNWTLPVNPYTGKTEMVTVSYDPPPGVTKVTDTFYYGSEYYGHNTQSVTRPVSGGGAQAPMLPPAWPLTARPPAAQADYYRWQVGVHFWPTEAQTMTTALCQDWTALLQDGHTFVALRFPVLPPTLSYTQPYTLPVVTGPDTPWLALMDDSVGPTTPVLTVPLEYKPEYHTFLENELPAAPGEHWLALGAVTTPTVDCAGVPPLTDWSFEAEVWLDFGGAQDAGRGSVLPLYYCYEGQSPPMTLLGASAASYQGWGITCLGPHSLYLESHVRPLELYGMHTGWVTPTQVISFSHSVVNWTGAPLTVTLAHSSTLGLPWGIYSGTADAPDDPLTPITGPFQLKPFGPNPPRHFWLIATAPAGTPSGAETLVITATDVTSPALTVWTSDLLWVGDWVAPPPPPWGYRLYLPLILRNW